MMSNMVDFAVRSSVCTLTLKNVGRRNALNAGMRKLLTDYLAIIESRDDIRSVLLVGEGPIFCSGQDLHEETMQVSDCQAPDIGRMLHEQYHPVYRALYRLTKPIVCAVHGAAIGGGATLAMACDFAIAGHSAKFEFPYAKLGLGLDAGASFFLVRRVGIARATELAMFGDPIDAITAASWGLIWKCVDDSILLHTAHDTAERLARGAPSALVGIKAALASAVVSNFDHQLDYERDLQRWLSVMPDYRVGHRAFEDKLSPSFR